MEENAAGFTVVTRLSKKRRRSSTSPTISEQTSMVRRDQVRSPNKFELLSDAARDGDANDEAGEGVLVNGMLNWDRVREGVSEVLISY